MFKNMSEFVGLEELTVENAVDDVTSSDLYYSEPLCEHRAPMCIVNTTVSPQVLYVGRLSIKMDPAPEPLFRASKRRKVMRKLFDDEEPHAASTSTDFSAPPPVLPENVGSQPDTSVERSASAEAEDGSLSVAEILRRRKLAKGRRTGIQFSNALDEHHGTGSEEQRVHVTGQSAIEAANNRFAPQTGLVTNVEDKHM